MRLAANGDDAGSPLGSALLGSPGDRSPRQRRRLQSLLTAAVVMVNLAGAAIVAALLAWVVPGPALGGPEFAWVNTAVVPAVVAVAMVGGVAYGTASGLRELRWQRDGREPTPRERQVALAMPWRLTRVQVALWTAATLLLGACYGSVTALAGPKAALTIATGGVVVCATSFLLAEFVLRPVAAAALAAGGAPRGPLSGVTARAVLGWLLGTGAGVGGLMAMSVSVLVHGGVSAEQLAAAFLVGGGVALVAGLTMTVLTARSVKDPVATVRGAMARVERGDLDTVVTVFDGTELGDLQSGFNQMAAGLRERRRLYELFGRHVGRQVAEQALSAQPRLGGEERQVAVFFIDVVGSTTLAATRPPQEIVALLNRFFAVVVEEVDAAGGFINKFEGDAALAVFGAPVPLADPAGAALAAARTIMVRLAGEVPEVRAGIGVSHGTAVAGNIGAHDRFEYTVIGDPVNEAARLSDLSKTLPGRIAASGAALAAADPAESARWRLHTTTTLRGRPTPTDVAVVHGG